MNRKKKNRFTFADDDVHIAEKTAGKFRIDSIEPKKKTADKFRIDGIQTNKKKLLSLIVIFSVAVLAVAFVLVIINYYKKPRLLTSPEKNSFSLSEKKEIPAIQSSNVALEKGKENYSKGYFSNAISYFNEVIESDAPDSEKAAALTYIGIIYDDRNNYNEAIEYYERALKYDDKSITTYRNLAIAHRHKGDLESAAKIIKKGLDIDTHNVQNRILFGNILYEQKNYKDAISEYEEALKEKDDPVALHNLALALINTNKESLAIEYLIKAGAADNTGKVAELSYSKLGVLYIDRKDFEAAEKYLRMAGSINPEDPVNRYNLGIVYLKTKQPEKALIEFEKAESLGKNDENLLENLGETYFSLNDYERSIAAYNKLLNNNTRNIRILSKLAEIYHEKGDAEKSLELYKRITIIEPATENARTAYVNMGNVYDDMGRYDEAVEMYNNALTINSEDDSVLYNLGIAYKNAGKPELSIKTWTIASELNPESPKPLMAIAGLYESKGLYDLAIESYQKITRRWDNLQEAHFNLASLYYKKNLMNYAKEEFKKVIDLNGNNDFAAKALTNLSIITLKTAGNNEAALDNAQGYVQKALLQKPNDADALITLGSVYFKKGMLEKAIDTLNIAISSTRDPKLIAEAYNNIGKSYHRMGQYENALKAFTRGLEEDPTMEEIRINRKVSMQAYEETLRR